MDVNVGQGQLFNNSIRYIRKIYHKPKNAVLRGAVSVVRGTFYLAAIKRMAANGVQCKVRDSSGYNYFVFASSNYVQSLVLLSLLHGSLFGYLLNNLVIRQTSFISPHRSSLTFSFLSPSQVPLLTQLNIQRAVGDFYRRFHLSNSSGTQ